MVSSSFKFSRSSSSSFSRSSVWLVGAVSAALATALAATAGVVTSFATASGVVGKAGLLVGGSTCVDSDWATADIVSLVAGVDCCCKTEDDDGANVFSVITSLVHVSRSYSFKTAHRPI